MKTTALAVIVLAVVLAGCATHFQPSDYASCETRASVAEQVTCYREETAEKQFLNADVRTLFFTVADNLVAAVDDGRITQAQARSTLAIASHYVSQSVRADQRAQSAALSAALANYGAYINAMQPNQQKITPFTCSQVGQFTNCY
jgi:hypothetical protein